MFIKKFTALIPSTCRSIIILKPTLHLQIHYNSCSTTRLQLFCYTTLSNWSICGDTMCVCVSYKPNFILSLLLHRASCRFTNYHTTNKCTNCMAFIFKSLVLKSDLKINDIQLVHLLVV